MNDEDVRSYQTGFNEGYILARYLPEIATKLMEIKGDNMRLDGFRDGIDICILEKAKDHAPAWLKKNLTGENRDVIPIDKNQLGKDIDFDKI